MSKEIKYTFHIGDVRYDLYAKSVKVTSKKSCEMITLTYEKMLDKMLKAIYHINPLVAKYYSKDDFVTIFMENKELQRDWVIVVVNKKVNRKRFMNFVEYGNSLIYVPLDKKICNSCSRLKPLTSFHNKNRGYGKPIKGDCKRCIEEQQLLKRLQKDIQYIINSIDIDNKYKDALAFGYQGLKEIIKKEK